MRITNEDEGIPLSTIIEDSQIEMNSPTHRYRPTNDILSIRTSKPKKSAKKLATHRSPKHKNKRKRPHKHSTEQSLLSSTNSLKSELRSSQQESDHTPQDTLYV